MMIMKQDSGYFSPQVDLLICRGEIDLGRKKHDKSRVYNCHFRTVLKEAREDFNKSNISFYATFIKVHIIDHLHIQDSVR